MALIINGVDFNEATTERYWTFPAGYKKDPKEETKNMIFSGEYCGARKMDGAYYRFIKDMDGNMVLQGRSKSVKGEYLNKIDHVPHLMPWFEDLPNGTCLLGEIYFPENEGSSNVTTIMNCLTNKAVERQKNGPKLHYYVFDIWAIEGESYMRKAAFDRFNELNVLSRAYPSKYVEYARYYAGEQLWDELEKTLASGGEGIVMTKNNTYPEPGKRTARKTLKVKKEIQQTIDCFFTGRATAPTRAYTGKEIESWNYWQNIGNDEKLEGKLFSEYQKGKPIEPITKSHFYNWAGSLEIGVMRDGMVVPIGFLSGLPEEVRANFKDYAMKPIEVTCMEIFTPEQGGGLRHAKMVQWRPDLNVEDCTWQKIHG